MRQLKELIGCKLIASDGEVGKVYDFFFDDFDWNLRYIIIEAGEWLDRRIVMFSPSAVSIINDAEKLSFKVSATRELIKSSPATDLERPISRQEEIDLLNHYQWPFYWERLDHSIYPLVEMFAEMKEKTGEADMEREDPHLRSARYVSGYTIEARDGKIGEVEDFIIDLTSWDILYLVVDTGVWITGRKVLLAPQWIQEIDWRNKQVRVDLERDTIKNSPEYDPSTLDRTYEESLYKHYNRQKYWSE
jgi:uncharacterized protein YrrD